LLGILLAFSVHTALLLFGGLLFAGTAPAEGQEREVELLTALEQPKPDDPAKDTAPEELEADDEPPPDAAEILKQMEPGPSEPAALDAVSLGAIAQALDGGGADFGPGVSFQSGGRIGGMGQGGAGDGLEEAFTLAEIGQRPQATWQIFPSYPPEMRRKRFEGVVSVIFVVDATGVVTDARVEESNHPAFEKPALDAIRQWRFEPASKAGKNVACRVRQQFRFEPN
jgi:protein TonB